jgi:hypothetical protein
VSALTLTLPPTCYKNALLRSTPLHSPFIATSHLQKPAAALVPSTFTGLRCFDPSTHHHDNNHVHRARPPDVGHRPVLCLKEDGGHHRLHKAGPRPHKLNGVPIKLIHLEMLHLKVFEPVLLRLKIFCPFDAILT